MNRLTEDQLKLAREMRSKGASWKEIAKETGASARGLAYNAQKNGWNVFAKVGNKVSNEGGLIAKAERRSLEVLADLVKEKLAIDVEASASALANWQADDLDLRDWQRREQIAESIQKRASSLLDIGNQDQNVVNIAVLSQLPEGASGSVIDG